MSIVRKCAKPYANILRFNLEVADTGLWAHIDAMLTDGAARLQQLTSPVVMRPSELAEKLGVTRQSVSKWLKGTAKPTVELMVKIEDLTGIPVRSWTIKAIKPKAFDPGATEP